VIGPGRRAAPAERAIQRGFNRNATSLWAFRSDRTGDPRMALARPFVSVAALSLALAGLGVAAPIVPPAHAAEADDLAQVSRYLQAIQSLRADFTQTDRTGQTIGGQLILKQPGRIRFAYQKDANLLIVSDGRALTLVDYEVRQVQRWPIRNRPLGVLLDPKRDLSRYGRVLKTADPDVVSIEVKDPKRPEYGVITLVFLRRAVAPAGLDLVGWVALDSQNKRTSVRLSNQRYNVPVADSEFRWTDPRTRRGPRR